MYGLHLKDPKVIKLVVGLHHGSPKVVKLEVGLHCEHSHSEQKVS